MSRQPSDSSASGSPSDSGIVRSATGATSNAATSNAATSDAATSDAASNVSSGAARNYSPESQASNGHQGADSTALSLDDPRTRVMLDQLMQVLATEGEAARETKSRSSFPDALGVLRRRWKPALVLFALVLVAVSWKLRPGEVSYVATATMLLPKSGGASPESALAALGGRRDAAGGSLDTQIAILQSWPFVQKAREVAKRNLQNDGKPTKSVDEAGLKATAPLSPELVDITITANEPNAAVALANASVGVYAQELVAQSDSTQKSDVIFVGQRLRDVEKKLRNAKIRLQNYKQANNVFDIQSALASNATTIENLEQKARATRIEAEAGATGETVLDDSITQTLQQKSADARLKYDTVLRDFFPSSPEARSAEADWRNAQIQLNNRVGTLVRQSRQQSNDAARALAEARGNAANLPTIEFRLSQLQSDVDQLGTTFRQLNDRYTTLNLTKSAKAATARMQIPAVKAAEVSRTWSRAIMTALLCALVLAGLCAIVLEQLDHSLHRVEDLEPLLPVGVLGVMPLLKGRSERRLAQMTGAQPMAPHVLEACRIIRSNLAFATMDSPAQTLLISSADPGEGKSLSALNLATVMAFDGRRVLLLDCDLRRPSQHTLNGLPLEPGFTNLLAGEATLENALQNTPVNNLQVLTAGTLPLNPPELLGSHDTREWLQRLKEEFDVIIIDSPPVLALTDAQVLCSQVDGVVMVVAADSTPKGDVQRAQAMLRHAGGRLLGAVFNKVRQSNSSAGYYAYGPSYGPNLLTKDRQLADSVGTLSRH